MRAFLCVAALCGVALSAQAEFADYRFVPPAKADAAAARTTAQAENAASRYRQEAVPLYQIDDYAGQRKALEQAAKGSALHVAAGADLGWEADALFEKPERDQDAWVWRAAISSVDATALRFQVDLSRLSHDETVWVVDIQGAGAFGPYTAADAEPGGRWLATTEGDTAILELRSPRPELPFLALERLSHYYGDILPKQTPCPLSSDCVDDITFQEVSTGIGRVTVTDESGNGALCSGALLNNALTDALEPFFLTADHCFQDFPATIRASGVEVLWDVRTNGCPGAEPSNAQIAQMPRSTGASFIANSTSLDAMLLTLGNVPIGNLGRAWLGWDTRAPRINDFAAGIHHPRGTAMKASFGRVTDINVNTQFGSGQTTIRWSDGITEGGSSGSPVMFDDGALRVFGMLSNGNFQSCANNEARVDQYSSFQSFFSAIQASINSENPVTSGQAVYRVNGSRGGGFEACFAPAPASSQSNAGNAALGALALLAMLGAARRRP
ncbi:MAG: hypothetical protein KF886_23285 [Candidatus Hydrogenedentes bacterium]|nr:hypothetical protein [Candidatus Hydrogenedentota bacterium]